MDMVEALWVRSYRDADERPRWRQGGAGDRAASRGGWLRTLGLVLGAHLSIDTAIIAAGVLGTVGWIGSERAIHRAPRTYPWRVADFPNVRPEPVRLTSRARTPIAGTFFPGRSRATIVLSHGYGDQQEQMLPWADFLNRAGYSVFTYDMRNRGASGGDAITLGALEQEDLLAVVDYLVTRPDVDPERIGALGLSLGAVATILAAARDPRIKAVVADSAFSDVPSAIDTAFEHFIGLPAFPFSPITVRVMEWRIGRSVRRVRPVDAIARISPRPVFLIHGLNDTIIPPDNGERNFAAAGEPKEVWWVPGACHTGSRDTTGAEYDRRVADFFRRHLNA